MSIIMTDWIYTIIERIGYKIRFWAWHKKLKKKQKK